MSELMHWLDRDRPRSGPGLPQLVAVAVALLFTWVPAPASSAVVEYTSLAELVELSDVVVRGEVLRRHSFYSEKQRRIVTHTTIEVLDRYMGDVDERLRIEQWGGTVDGRTVRIPGDATFETGEEVVVFLRRGDDRPGGPLFLTALAQSKYTVDRSSETPLVSRDLSDLEFKSSESDDLYRVEGRVDSLSSFVARLRTLIYSAEGEAP